MVDSEGDDQQGTRGQGHGVSARGGPDGNLLPHLVPGDQVAGMGGSKAVTTGLGRLGGAALVHSSLPLFRGCGRASWETPSTSSATTGKRPVSGSTVLSPTSRLLWKWKR